MLYFEAGKDFDSKAFRIPFCEVTNDGVVIVGGDVRYDHSGDVGNIDIGIARSLDKGESFQDKKIILSNHRLVENSRIIDACILVARNTNRVFVFGHCIDSNNLWEDTSDPEAIDAYMVYTYSDDNGLTWSAPISLAHLKDESMVSLFPGPGKGIMMADGTLVVPCQIKTNERDGVPPIQSCIIFSKDGGESWQYGGGRVEEYSSECQAVEMAPGILMLNCRSYAGYRRVYVSDDLGQTWTPHETNNNTLIEPYACQASLDLMTRENGELCYVFCNPHSSQERAHITLQISSDAIHWECYKELVEELTYGYTCVCHEGQTIYTAVEYTGSIALYRTELK